MSGKALAAGASDWPIFLASHLYDLGRAGCRSSSAWAAPHAARPAVAALPSWRRCAIQFNFFRSVAR